MGCAWAVGVTTVPQRRRTLLPMTLASLREAGWASPRLFVDGDADGASWRAEFGLEVTCRSEPARVAGNWLLSLCELYWRQPCADRFLLAQDDVVFYRNLRQYLELTPYPEGGYQNLYTSRFNHDVIHGKKIGSWCEAAPVRSADRKLFVDDLGRPQQGGKGALALVFDQAAVQALLCSPHMLQKPKDPQEGWRRIDGAVVEALNRAGIREYVHAPSLCQHRGYGEGETLGDPGYESTILLPVRDEKTGETVMRPKERPPGAASFMGEWRDAVELFMAPR